MIAPLGISGQMEEYKNRLQQVAAVYDMEQYTEFSETDRYFIDGFHLTNRFIWRSLIKGGSERVIIKIKRNPCKACMFRRCRDFSVINIKRRL